MSDSLEVEIRRLRMDDNGPVLALFIVLGVLLVLFSCRTPYFATKFRWKKASALPGERKTSSIKREFGRTSLFINIRTLGSIATIRVESHLFQLSCNYTVFA
jgi:hypothetical protein